LFAKAQAKFRQELDVVRIVKTLRRYKMFAQAMLSQKHRLLLKFQRQNLIETTSSSSDSDKGDYDEMRMMENKNPLIRLVAYSKIKKMLRQFEGNNVNELERNMMRGLFMRSIKDFAEETKKNSKKTLFERLKAQDLVEMEGSELNEVSQILTNLRALKQDIDKQDLIR
jgi:transketolase